MPPSPPHRRIRLALAVTGVVIGAPVVLLAAAAVALTMHDWNGARPWINQRLSESTGRQFEIRGPLSLSWHRQGASAAGQSWFAAVCDWLPSPQLVAHDVHVGNPAGVRATEELASIGQLAFTVDPLPLLQRRIVVPLLRFQQPKLSLRRDEDGRNNWTFHDPDQPARWKIAVQRVVFSKGTIHYVDAGAAVDAVAEVDSIHADRTYGVSWTVRGSWNRQPVSGSGKSGAVLALHEQVAPFPLAASLDVGGTRLAVEGTLTKPTALTALDMRLSMSGPSMARLYGITGVLLPETPAFATEGHLTGTIGRDGSRWVYDGFTGKVGSSDLAGKLEYRSGNPRPVLTGSMQSRLLQLSDLGPLVGADSNASKQARGVEAVQPGNRVLPVEAFRTERWTALDADVNFKAQRITRDRGLPIYHVDTLIHMKDGVLALKPLNFDIAGGRFTSNIVLDGSGKVDPQAIRADLKAVAERLQLKQLFPNVEGMQATVGEVNANVALSARGNSVAGLLGSSNGEFRGAVSGGSVSKLLLEEMGLNLGSVVVTRLFGDEQVKLNCLVADFGVRDGLMRSRLFVADTAEAVIHASGSVNLDNEKLDLTLKPEAKSMRILSLRSPVYVRGTFQDAQVSIDKGSMALRAGSALALAAVAPVAAVLPLISTGPEQTAACSELLARGNGKAAVPARSGTKG